MWLGVKLGVVHQHIRPDAQLRTSTIVDQREWYVNRGLAIGMIIATRELD